MGELQTLCCQEENWYASAELAPSSNADVKQQCWCAGSQAVEEHSLLPGAVEHW